MEHNSEELEQRILTLIEEGKSEELQKLLTNIPDGNRSSGFDLAEGITAAHIIFISAAALCPRAAIRGGMDYERALSLSDEYLHRMLAIKDAKDVWPLLGLMMLDFAKQVEQLRTPDDASPVTKAIVRRIHAGLRKPLRIADMAEEMGYSPAYLSHVFKKDMGMDIKTYILKAKIEEAKRLLAQGQTIPQVAEALSFSSSSHLGTVFRKVTGMTIRDYMHSL